MVRLSLQIVTQCFKMIYLSRHLYLFLSFRDWDGLSSTSNLKVYNMTYDSSTNHNLMDKNVEEVVPP